MKQRLLFTIAVLLTGLYVMAQEPTAMKFDHEMEWLFYGCDSNSDRTWFHEFCRFDGTAEKNGKTYHVLKISRAFLDNGSGNMPSGYQDQDANGSLCVRSESGRIYVDREEYMSLISGDSYWHWIGNKDYIPYPQTSEGELILYDFNMKSGDKFATVEGHETVYVAEVKSVVTKDGLTRKLYILSNGYQIIEGIGCTNSPGLLLFYLNPGLAPYNRSYLSFYGYHSQETGTWNAIYDGTGETSGINNTLAKHRVKGLFYNLQGLRIGYSPTKSKQVYIHDGKKCIK